VSVCVCVFFSPFLWFVSNSSEGCASAVKRILGKIEGEEYVSPCGLNYTVVGCAVSWIDLTGRRPLEFFFSSL
jgi:hypothetical protein